MGEVRIERGLIGRLPFAAVGSGPPLIVLAGLSPVAGVASDALVRGALAPVRGLTGRRRVIVLNRRSGLPAGLSMAELAREHAEAIASLAAGPVDVVGLSTGGSIAQQLAADHGPLVARLALVSTAGRLGPVGRQLQQQVGRHLRAGQIRRAAGLAAGGLVPRGLRPVAHALGWASARRVITSPAAAADLAATIEAEDGFDLRSCAEPIRARTLIIAGGRDRFYGVDLFQETAAAIPGSELRLFPKRGHLTVTRDRRALATLAGFLSWSAADRDSPRPPGA